MFTNPFQGAELSLILLILWSFILKAIALWRAARLDQKYWFIALLPLNTLGILELVYLFFFAKKKLTLDEIKSWNLTRKKKTT